jgi:hypothetical protein
VVRHRLLPLAVPLVLLASMFVAPPAAAAPGVGNLPQGTQSDWAYAQSSARHSVTNVFATTQQTSCYRPENPYPGTLAPLDGYTGMSACTGATTGENIGTTPYPSQVGSNAGYPAAGPMLVKNHSESDIRVDPTNAKHLIGSSKWAVSAEGYNHLLGFYESWDGGLTWATQGHIPGYEGWTDNTDPIGAFDSFGNYYSLILPYEFYYNNDGSKNYQTNQNKEPNPTVPAEAITVAIRKHGAIKADDWSTKHGVMDIVAPYPAKGREPDKQWITIDLSSSSPHFNRIYAMWTVFDGISATPWVSYADAKPDGTHTAWSAPRTLPTAGSNPQGDTYLLPHTDGSGTVYTTVTNFQPKQGFCCTSVILDKSTDGGVTWQSVSNVITDVTAPPLMYPNTNFRDGIEDTFAVGPLFNGVYPLYVAWEDHSTGFGNLILSASYDGGQTWSAPIQVNDNVNPNVDAVQPNLTAAADGTVVVAFYDRRLACPAAGAEASAAGLALDTANSRYAGSLPPYGAVNYCINASVQLYNPNLRPIWHNIRISLHTWDPQLNSMKPSSIGATEGFIGDYYGNITSGKVDLTTSVSTYNDSTNPAHFQQQVVASVAIP